MGRPVSESWLCPPCMSQTPLLQASQSEPSINRKRPRFIGLAIDCTKSSPIVTGLVKNITKSFPIRLLTGKLSPANFSGTTAILLAAATTGCNNDGIAVYEAPKDAGFAHLHEGHNHASEAPFDLSSRAPGIEFKLPSGWQEQAPGSQIQVANIRISEGDERAQVTVVPLPDISQNELQVVNIWRESLGMEPATEADLPSLKQATTIGPVEGVIYDFLADPDSGQMPTNANRILVGIANHQQLSYVLPDHCSVSFRKAAEDSLGSPGQEEYSAVLRNSSDKGFEFHHGRNGQSQP